MSTIEPRATKVVFADAPHFSFHHAPPHEFVAGPAPFARAVRFIRPVELTPAGYKYDAPAALIVFRARARALRATLIYSQLHQRVVYNGRAAVYVDGVCRLVTPDSPAPTPRSADMPVAIDLPVPDDQPHTYAIALPYADSVEFAGLEADPAAEFLPPPPPHATRCVAYGDSVVHGFTAADATGPWPARLARTLPWNIINLGLGGRAVTPADASAIVSLAPHVVIAAIGVNDWQGSAPLDDFAARLGNFLSAILAGLPGARIFYQSPLWVSANWKPGIPAHPLDAYRAVIDKVLAGIATPRLTHIDGRRLIDPDETLFDTCLVHPNDRGFAQLTARLAAILADIPVPGLLNAPPPSRPSPRAPG